MRTDMGTIVLAQASNETAFEQDLEHEIQSEVGAEPSGGGGMPQLEIGDYPAQIVWLAISFVALYFLMSRVALPRIATVIENRRDRIAHDLDTAARLKQETDEVISAYEADLADARSKAHQIAADTRERLNAEIAEERAKIEAELADKTTEAEDAVAQAKARALAEIGGTASAAAGDIVTTLIGVKPTGKELDEALKAVGQG